MTKRISTFTVEAVRLDLFVSDCGDCGVIFGIPVEMEARRREDHRTFHCPNGHALSFQGPTKAERDAVNAKAQADRLRTMLYAEQDQAEAARREAAEAKASEVRLRWRVGNGVCPCCSRTFPGLASHVATKHPDFLTHDLDALSARQVQLLASLRAATEENDDALVDVNDAGLDWRSVRALERRNLVAVVGRGRIALTETGWPLAEQAAGVE